MPSFTFTSPDGKNYTVDGPDGATKEQAFAQLQGSLKGGSAKADSPPPAPEATPFLTQVGHTVMDAGGTIARGVGSAMDMARNVAAKLPGSKATPVEYGSPDSESAQLSAPFAHAPDYEPPSTDPKEAIRQGLPKLGDQPAVKEFVANHPVLQPLSDVGNAVMTAGAVGQVPSALSSLRAGADSLVNRVAQPSATQAETIASNPAIEKARQAGFKLTGNDVRNAVNAPDTDIPGNTRQNLADQGVTDQIQRHNRALATQSAAEDVGLGNTRAIQDDQIAMGKTKAGTVYDKMGRAIGQRAPNEISPQFNADLGSAGARAASPEGRTAVEQQVDFYKQHFASEGFNGPDAVASARDLRQQAYKQMASPDVDQQVLGKTNLSIANAIENEMQRLLPVQYQGLKTEFPAARQQYAKLSELEEATEGGQVNAQTFKRLRDAGAPLTGAAADIAHAADVAPESMAQAVGPASLHVPVSHSGTLRTVVNAGARAVRALPGMNPATEAFQEANYGPRGKPAVDIPPPEVAPDLKLQPPPGSLPMRGQDLPLGPAPGGPPHDFALEPPAGNAPAYPIQRDLPLAAREAPADLARAPQKMTTKERAIWERAVMERLGNGQ